MATQKGVWNLQQVRDKQLQSLWDYAAPSGVNALFSWGYNRYGQLGQNTASDAGLLSSPTQIPGSWSKVTSGKDESAAVKTDGTLWVWGRNNYGQLGQNAISNPADVGISSPIQVPGTTWNIVSSSYADEIMAIKTDGAMWNWGRSGYTGGPIFEGQAFPSMRSSPVQLSGTWGNVLDTRRLTFAEKVF